MKDLKSFAKSNENCGKKKVNNTYPFCINSINFYAIRTHISCPCTNRKHADGQTPSWVCQIGPFPNNSDNLKFLLETEAYVSLLDIPLGGSASDSTHSMSLHLRGMLFSISSSVVISSLPGTGSRKGGINDNIGQPFSISTGAMLSWF